MADNRSSTRREVEPVASLKLSRRAGWDNRVLACCDQGDAMAGVNTASRIVITGVGTVSPIGIGNDAFWDSLASGLFSVEVGR